jgi:hypothetical protein
LTLPSPVQPKEPALWRARLADLRGRGAYAGVADRFRCIFIHIPKTAGNSVALALFGSQSRHVSYTEYLRANPRKFRRYFKFSFVRNPWDRLVSIYFFMKKGGMNDLDRRWSEQNLRGFESFEHFVCEGLEQSHVRSWVHFRPQADFIASDDDEIMVDFVGRFENLTEDFASVARKVGAGSTLSLTNSSPHEPFASYYTRRSAEAVARFYERDARLFGYKSPIEGAS